MTETFWAIRNSDGRRSWFTCELFWTRGQAIRKWCEHLPSGCSWRTERAKGVRCVRVKLVPARGAR